ncbi:8171_t:CDS:2 [Diversispora eburnea]|uniref:8171_t:CDS:1 n=1 Tax=Diversispora eburnea TaxID=1213867 RepID=A0A9N8ZWY8_9GLOM|nr:8171_t:CDS:2 [Diversispora eburnea]
MGSVVKGHLQDNVGTKHIFLKCWLKVGTVRHGTQRQLKKLETCKFDNTAHWSSGLNSKIWSLGLGSIGPFLKIRLGSEEQKNIIQSKINTSNNPGKFYNTTHQVTFKLLYSYLPFDRTLLTSISEDILDFGMLNENNLIPHFKTQQTYHILYTYKKKETVYFNIDGKCASRKQFPLQNSFVLATHKVQGLTLPYVTIDESVFAEAS